MTERPIFIVGVGRSGSSIFHQMMSTHPNVSWLSGVNDRYPEKPYYGRWTMHALNIPGFSGFLRSRLDPGECYAFWDHFFPGFSVPFRDLRSDDVTELPRRALLAVLSRLTTRKRSRLLFKITGWPRLRFLHELFPDSLFLNVIRDGRPVASSFLRVPWWKGWRGPEQWRWGPLPDKYREEWERHNCSFIALAGIQWKILVESMEAAKLGIPRDHIMDIRYEKLCANPHGTIAEALSFCGLSSSPAFERSISGFQLRSENDKWRRDFSPAQQDTLEDVLRGHLVRLGYPT